MWFVIADRLFGRETAYLFVSFMAVYSVFQAHAYFNPHGAYFLIPLFFYFFVRYVEKRKIAYVIGATLTSGLLIQFELAVGIPYMILLGVLVFWSVWKKRVPLNHVVALCVIIFPLANFIIFELRHAFIISHGVITYLESPLRDIDVSYVALIKERISLLLTGTEFIRENPHNIRLVATLVFITFLIIQIRQRKRKHIHLLFIYMYVGYLVVSFINRGAILYFYQFPQFPLTFLIFSSFVTSKYKQLFLGVFLVVLVLNFEIAYANVRASEKFSGIDIDSWKFQRQLAEDMYSQNGEYGYFVFAPDSFGYPTMYALKYVGRRNYPNVFPYHKKPVTYVVEIPDRFLKPEWWVTNILHITSSPSARIEYANGFTIERFELIQEEIDAPIEEAALPGIHFR